ncbi:hypothetical protein [Paraburkholderia tropica]|uniref:hypothetical protein n=1 Tax=Paraburkholderia tropica TaxID=92647 RepID=UPI002AB64791|nr:hypothetical protein [Paraburkholderia tropica]
MQPPDHLINVMLALFCAVMGLIAGVLVALASMRAASSRTADMRKAWGSVAALVGLSWASLAIGCFGVVQHHLSFALVGAGVFCVALLSMVNDRFRGFLIQAAEQEKRAAR